MWAKYTEIKLMWVMLDIPSQYMRYGVVLLCEVYCVIVWGLGMYSMWCHLRLAIHLVYCAPAINAFIHQTPWS